MYTDEEIFTRVSLARHKIGRCKTFGEFIRKYQKGFVYPSTALFRRRYGNMVKLFKKVDEWECAKCRILRPGRFASSNREAILNIQIDDDPRFFKISVIISHAMVYDFQVPRWEG